MPLQNRSDPQERWRGARNRSRRRRLRAAGGSPRGRPRLGRRRQRAAQGPLRLEGASSRRQARTAEEGRDAREAVGHRCARAPRPRRNVPRRSRVWSEDPGRPRAGRLPRAVLRGHHADRAFSSLAQGGTLAHLLGSLGHGTLRFGGGSVNRYVAWQQPGTPRPRWATHPVTPTDLRALGSLDPPSRLEGAADDEPGPLRTRAARRGRRPSARREINSALAGHRDRQRARSLQRATACGPPAGTSPSTPASSPPTAQRSRPRHPARASRPPTCRRGNHRCHGCGNRSLCTPRSSPTTTTR